MFLSTVGAMNQQVLVDLGNVIVYQPNLYWSQYFLVVVKASLASGRPVSADRGL